MIFQLIDKNVEMCNQWNIHFKDCNDVKVHCGDFFSLETDCVVSPANSFGFMDGGLDLAISKKLGWEIQGTVKNIINEMYDGELLVGQAIIVSTGNNKIPYCISAPTMRVPMIIKDTVNVYLASKAIFTLLKKLKNENSLTDINKVTISGLGTGVGKVPYDICAKQMKQAYIDHWLEEYTYPINWFDAQRRHQLLYSNEYKDLQY